MNKHVFGVPLANIHVIEFQKRGLPHAHMLIILRDQDKPRTQEIIDRFVSAEIPDPTLHPRLHEVVLRNMVHGPCGKLNLSSPCMENGKCTKEFPKPFQEETIPNSDGYPHYRRRDTGTFPCRNKMVDNRWIVPYNPYLSLKYNCHVNVEICATVKSVKYLFKYVYKGHDCANIEIRENDTLSHDEVKSYMDSRYVSAPEAMWRLFAFKMHDQSHAIIRLAVHLPDQQNVYFQEGHEAEAIQSAERRDTTLTAWFKLNLHTVNARQYLYSEIPDHYVFHSNANDTSWKPRQREAEKIISRIYTVSLLDPERYYLRLLLLHIRGAKGFDDLKTVDGTICESFKEAARLRNLLDDDKVWHDTLDEAASNQMPNALRLLFAIICVLGSPTNVLELWNNHKSDMMEDFVHRHNQHSLHCNECELRTLEDIQDTLIMRGKRCTDFGLPEPPSNIEFDVREMFDKHAESAEGERMTASLTAEQRVVFNSIMDAVDSEEKAVKCFFLDGPGGSGKTYIYKTLLSVIRGRGEIVLPVASTGLAANLLNGGRTYHSQYKLPVPLLETSVSSMKMCSAEAHCIRNAKLLIWDESTMASIHALNAVDRLLKEIMNCELPFGGKVVLLGGDFRQCLPILPHGHRAAIVQTCMKYSPIWNHFVFMKLNNNVRSDDAEYSKWLIQLGDGQLQNTSGLPDYVIEIPDQFLSKGSLVDEIFGNKITVENIPHFARRTILSAKNEDVDCINNDILQCLEGDSITYQSVDSIDCQDEQDVLNFPVEFLNSLTPSGMPPHNLILKIGAIIMLLRNLNTKRGLYNGTRLLVVRLSRNVIEAKVITGSAENEIVFIPRITLAPRQIQIFHLY